LKTAGISVTHDVLESKCAELNEGFNHWVVHKTPNVILKSAMSLDGKIATESGESKWITGEEARQYSMRLRKLSDAILVGVNTIIADNPELTYRKKTAVSKSLRRIILDSNARTPISSKVVSDNFSRLTTIFVTEMADKERVDLLKQHCNVIVAPQNNSRVDIQWVLRKLGEEWCLNIAR
jgi:diaminohydroxyphosphoribosylaminopyrimidine deaminase/5-amino-6-(5-phosphoribosylamino)uracil reductase